MSRAKPLDTGVLLLRCDTRPQTGFVLTHVVVLGEMSEMVKPLILYEKLVKTLFINICADFKTFSVESI